MADGYESARSEEYFNGGMKPRPVPRRLVPKQRDKNPPAQTESPAPKS
ncbi:MAG: hypothetical protein SOZ52_04375 [Pyramidobacter sp.]|nr:hypothetical protein [Pyramidobacter sp.]